MILSTLVISLFHLVDSFSTHNLALPEGHRLDTIDGIQYIVFGHNVTASNLSYVTNSGICETTPGVTQYSGYLTVGKNMNVFFWFFEARNSPDTTPLALWLNGGPGCSSMVGLFIENGPCHFNAGGTEPKLNPYSWNTVANMLYVDQPVGVGLSYGDDDNVNSTASAAEFMWVFLQNFYAAFPKYQRREFGLFTESYGGHYGPKFATYFQSQNALIDQGKLHGHQKVSLAAVGINNGWIAPIVQFRSFIDFAVNNTYRQLLDPASSPKAVDDYNTDCLPYIQNCTSSTGNDEDCAAADQSCYAVMSDPIEISSGIDFDPYDVRANASDPNPPSNYIRYLLRRDIRKAIGARVPGYTQCSEKESDYFYQSGDGARSFLPELSELVRSGVQVLLWAGDTDWTCNWMGNLDVANMVDYPGQKSFTEQPVTPYTVKGTVYGEFKTVDNLSWLRVYQAGHEVPFYQPQVALQAFWQTISRLPLSPT
ncbi:Alpha/Beta hydrolase protein [Podospora australis]|uniref:Carboxypeptidase n=1 Tax=Podospora australis TaxID=1536484 RepID=A0AAN6WLB8_9PEZI|nr:Alpha/Beta hydrolase protein [Podospora australis]